LRNDGSFSTYLQNEPFYRIIWARSIDADLYYFNVSGDIDTRALSNGKQYLDSIGYTTYNILNTNANNAWNWWKNDALFITAGHGAPGAIEFANKTIIAGEDKNNANRANGYSEGGFTFYYIKNFGNTDINDCLVAMFLNCESALDATRYGNILGWARAKGVDCAIGWTSGIGDHSAGWFGTGFARGAWDKNYVIDSPQGFNIGDIDLMQYAYSYMLQAKPVDDRLQNFETRGQHGQKLQPARYGTP